MRIWQGYILLVGRKMKKRIVLCGVVLVALLLLTAVIGCQQQQPVATPSLTIMVESSIVEAGSSFVVSGSNFKPHQKVWINFEYRASDRTEGIQVYCEADENGSIYPIIDIPQDAVPGDYEVRIFVGKHLSDRKLLATLPIHIQARANTFTSTLPLTAQKTTLEEASSQVSQECSS